MLEHPAPHPDLDNDPGNGLDHGLDYGLRPEAVPFTVIGIDFGGTKTEIALADPHGAVLARERIPTLADRGPEQALARAGEAAARLVRTSRESFGAPVAAHAAVAPGIVQADRILLTPNLPGWERIALASRLAEELKADSVSVANDVRAGALAELRFGALRDADPGVYVSLGTGIAAALTVGGRVLAGAHHAAGEIGYMNPGDSPADAVAAGRAPLEEAVAGKGLGERAAELLGLPVTAEELFRSELPAARELVDETLTLLATALANLTVFVDPERIVLGGGMMASADVILPRLTELITAATPFPPEVRAARFLKDASLHGAVALALDGLAPGAPAALPAVTTLPDLPDLPTLPATTRPGATR
ncbi:ROK family protein [Streptacidiphilus fuscans]|uniref:ROK family protein n=1 Tax=Streptacidiphilus fuscans TaxID=2789292 RepID=A0A931B1Z0_9ACTN|nr:ROK family protein [Streptacidiphilus fuscans]MBF9069614.1 ROK family protein [Streptacidiphilus fuscans]